MTCSSKRMLKQGSIGYSKKSTDHAHTKIVGPCPSQLQFPLCIQVCMKAMNKSAFLHDRSVTRSDS